MRVLFRIVALMGLSAFAANGGTLSVNTSAPGDVVIGQANKDVFTQIIASTASRRGQTFTMPETGDTNTAYDVTSITLQKSGGAGQTGDLSWSGTGANLKLMVYEWDPAADANDSTQWTTSGGSNSDPWNGTGMTNVYTGSFALDGLTVSLDDYLHFNFDTPLSLEKNKAYGFLVQYFKAGSATDNIVLQQGGNGANNYSGGDLLVANGGGAVSRTMTANTDLTFWISGTAGEPPVELTVDAAAPADVIVGQSNKDAFTQTISSSNAGRGQSFTMPDTGDTNTSYSISSIALQKSGGLGQTNALTFADGDLLKLWVFEWNPTNDANDATQWNAGTENTANDPLAGTGMTELLAHSLSLDGVTISLDDYINFNFAPELILDENKTYGFLVQYINGSGLVNNLVLQQGGGGANNYAGGNLLRADGATHSMTANTDLTFMISGRVIGAGFSVQMSTDGSALAFQWGSYSGATYDLESSMSLTPVDWLPYNDGAEVYTNIAGSGTGTNTLTDVLITDPVRFFRIIEN